MENAVNEEVKSKRSMLDERLKSRYPDKDFSDEENFYGQISDDYDEYDNRIKTYEDREKQLTDMFSKDPRSAAFLSDWRNGEDPEVALIRRHGKDTIMAAIEDPEKLDIIAEANKEYVERVAENEKLEEQYKSNLEASSKMLEDVQKEKGLTDEQVDNVFDAINAIARDAIVGKYSRETFDMVSKALNYDADVAEASEEGEIRGRNARIDEKIRTRGTGDGLPVLGGKSNNTETNKRARSIFDVARGAQ